MIEYFKGKKIFITGNTGFKGSWLTQILLNAGAKVSGYALKPESKPSLFHVLNLDKRIKTYYSDIRDLEVLKGAIYEEKPDIIFHLAAQPLVRESYANPVYTFQTNVIGTLNIMEALRTAESINTAIMITTDKVYENKEWVWPYRENDVLGGYDPYSTSKVCAEHVIASYRKSFFNFDRSADKKRPLFGIVRAGNVIGGGDWSKDRLIPDIVRVIFSDDEKAIIRNPDSTRPWQHVVELLFGYLKLAKYLDSGRSEFEGEWNFAPPAEHEIRVEEIVKSAINMIGKGSYEIQSDETMHEANLLLLDASKARKYLDWNQKLSVDKMLEWTFRWYESFYKDKSGVAELTNSQIKEYDGLFDK